MIDASWAKPTRTLSRKSANLVALPLGLATFVISLVFGAIVHLDLPASRLMAKNLTLRFFNQHFSGQIAIAELGRFDLGGLTAQGVVITDPEKRPVIQAGEVEVNVSLIELLVDLLTTQKKTSIVLDRVTLRRPAVQLLSTTKRGPDGEPLSHPSIADAFVPRVPPKAEESAGRPVRIWFPEVRLERFYLRGRVSKDQAGEVHVPLAKATVLVTDRGLRVDVERFGLRASGFGGVDTLAVGDVRMRLPGAIDGSVRGKIGSIPIAQAFRFEGDHVLIEGALPSLEASALRPLFAGWPLDGTIGVRNRIEGTLPRLSADVLVTAGAGHVHATGLLTTAPELEADLDVDTKDLDLSTLGTKLPRTRLNLRSAVEVWLTDQRPNLEVNATLAESEYEDTPLPVVDLRANYDERGLTADATLHERGLPVHLAVSGDPRKRLEFELSMRRTSLTDSPRLDALLHARGEVSGEVKGHIEGTSTTATWTLAANGLAYQSVSLSHVESKGGVSLDLKKPDAAEVSLDLEAKGLAAGGVVLPEVRLHASGPIKQPTVALDATTQLGAPVHLAATVHPDWPGVSQLSGRVGGGDQEVGIKLDRAASGAGEVRVRGLVIQSGGSLEGDLAIGSGAGEARLTARDFDLRRLVASFGLDRANLEGQLDLDVDAKLAQKSSGHARIKLTKASILGVSGLEAELYTDLDGQRLVGQGTAQVAGVLGAAANWNVEVGGPIALAKSYSKAKGSLGLDVQGLELAWLRRFLPQPNPVTRASGTLDVHLEAERQDSGAFPDLRFRAKTAGLSIDIGEGEAVTRLDAMDLSVRGSVNSERQRIELAVGLRDSEGDLVTASGGMGLPLAEWLEQPPTPTEVVTTARVAPLECVVLVPERRVVDFPQALGLPAWDGSLTARAIVRGSIDDPEFDLNASGQNLEGNDLGLLRPISVETSARYRLSTGRLSGSLQARQGSSRVASAALKMTLPAAHLSGEVPAGTPAWTGAAQVVVEDAPLGLIATLTEQRLTGTVQGSIGIVRKGYPTDVDASLRLKQLVLGETSLGEGELALGVHDGKLRATTKLEDEFGNLEAQAALSVLPTPWALALDPAADLELGIRSSGHDAAVLLPFADETLSELGGELNGSLDLRLRPRKSPDAPLDATIHGQMTMQDGIVTPRAMGLRFTETTFELRAQRQGEFNVLYLTGLRAKARSTSENLRGEATVYLKGLSFDHATFTFDQTRLPLMKAGAQVASVTGRLRGEFKTTETRQEVRLDLSGLAIDLPSVADADVIELSENPTVEIVQRPRKEEVVKAGTDSTPLYVAVDLGRGVKVESSLFEVMVRGRPELEIAETTTVSGQVQLQEGGTVTVLGKVFLIEEGLIAFDTYDSTNPHLDVSATWRASSGVLVRAKISGTAREPILEWSSEPPLAGGEAEVIALVIGGGGGSTSSGGGQGQGVAMAGMALAVNQIIGETGLRNVEVYAGREAEATEGEVARLSQRSWDSYTASIQLTEDLWFQGSYKQESVGPGSEPRAGVSGTLDWRFAPAWSASTEIGTLGMGLDMLWQHRY